MPGPAPIVDQANVNDPAGVLGAGKSILPVTGAEVGVAVETMLATGAVVGAAEGADVEVAAGAVVGAGALVAVAAGAVVGVGRTGVGSSPPQAAAMASALAAENNAADVSSLLSFKVDPSWRAG